MKVGFPSSAMLLLLLCHFPPSSAVNKVLGFGFVQTLPSWETPGGLGERGRE